MVNLGGAPHDSDDIQDLWYALQEAGLAQVGADGSLRIETDLGSIDSSLHDKAISGDTGTFGSQAVANRINQFDAKFYKDTPSDRGDVLVTSKTGSATEQEIEGSAVINSGTDTTAEYIAQSAETIIYDSAKEIYMVNTASWPQSPTAESDVAQIGLYDDEPTEGYMWGYNGTEWGISHYTNTEEVFIPQSEFNVDKLDGTDSSRFYREGEPEAIDVSKINVFRTRFGWLGSATTTFEVMAPDGHWVVAHRIEHPNSRTTPQTSTPNLPGTIKVQKNDSDSTNIEMTTSSWGGGIMVNATTAQQPDGDYTPIRASGQATRNGNLLAANEEVTTDWIDSDGWGSLQIDVDADQPSADEGLTIQFTDDANAINSIVRGEQFFTLTQKNVDDAGTLHVVLPTQLDGFRIKYRNGDTGQNRFLMTSTLLKSSRDRQTTLSNPIDNAAVIGSKRAITWAETDDGSFESVLQSQNGGLRTSTVEHEVDTPIRAYQTIETEQQDIPDADGGGPVEVLTSPINDRNVVMIRNDGDVDVYVGEDSTLTDTNGFPISPGNTEQFDIDETVNLWMIGADATGTSATHRLDPTAASTDGTVTNPDNVIASDDTYAIYDAQNEYIDAAGYDATSASTQDNITEVYMGLEAEKDDVAGTQTVTHEETVTNTQSGGTSITTESSLARVDEDSYFVFVSYTNDTHNITSIDGLELDWVQVSTSTFTDKTTIELWKGTGTPGFSGGVTANFDGDVAAASIAANRYNGVEQIEATGVNNTKSDTWSATVNNSTSSGRVISGASIVKQTSSDPGTDDTEHSDENGGTTLTMATQSRPGSGGSETPDGTWAASGGWAAIAASLQPTALANPEAHLEYEVGAEGTGETSDIKTVGVTEDNVYMVDVTGDRNWTLSDIDNTTVTVTLSNDDSENLEADHIFMEFVEVDSAATQRVAFTELA